MKFIAGVAAALLTIGSIAGASQTLVRALRPRAQCRLRAVDTFTKQSYVLAASPASKGRYTYKVVDAAGSKVFDTSYFGFDEKGALLHEGGMPDSTKMEIMETGRLIRSGLKKSEAFEDGQILWVPVEGAACSDVEAGLIRFYNEEFILH